MDRAAVRTSTTAGLFLALLALGIAACGGPHWSSTNPSPAVAEDASLTLRVRLPASFAGTALMVSVTLDGSSEPAATVMAQLGSSACVLGGGERLCTLRFAAPVGLLDVAVRANAAGSGRGLSGTALRQLLPAAGSTLSLAFDGAPARWGFSPQMLAAPADGATHQVPFAVVAQDAQGFTLLQSAPCCTSSASALKAAERSWRSTAAAQWAT
jgi:hypothetical protein